MVTSSSSVMARPTTSSAKKIEVMQTKYQTPCTSVQPIYHSSILCGSDRVSSNIDLKGGDESGDVTGAF